MKPKRCWHTTRLLLVTLLLSGCAAAASAPAGFIPSPDGRYDNHTYLVDPSRMDVARVADSIVSLVTRTTFAGPGGEIIQRSLEGSGVVLGRFVLTAEHTVGQHTLEIPTPFGSVEFPVLKKNEETFLRWRGVDYPLRVLYKDQAEDIALFELPAGVQPPSFPHPLGNSDDLQVGNFIYVVGNPMNLGVNVREGIVSALRAPGEISRIGAKGENAFMVSNGLLPGDSGTPVIGIRDGQFELVGISQGTILQNNRLGWVIRINVIRDSLRAAQAHLDERWAAPPRTLPVSVRGTGEGGGGSFLAWPASGFKGNLLEP